MHKKNASSYRIHLCESVLSRYLLRTRALTSVRVFVSACVLTCNGIYFATQKLLVYQRCHCQNVGLPADFPRAGKAVLAAKIEPQRIS
jgi:hypothetical protein